ncbi:hypothetical protein Cylst_2516 [Cylindrospermum stagnale PCC 7417]|uniref:Uncharacterized protein n=1 Tax=Cylindrospermum stagnale PCC 7417 TaxID=56107 RepID=K9WWG6_9NOST|nr:hypothetical protein [Cylindrospermum stagnale]AFZ24725.1 hypothetical protein Cylst_2516 [Cylindrospermum stagnale PCC 7417]
MQLVKTVVKAQAQVFTLTEKFDDQAWRQFARLIDGYAIAQELGFDLMTWGETQETAYRQSGIRHLNILELRLMLFYEFRADYMSGYTYHERDHLVDSLLAVLSKATDQPYQRI